MSSTLDLPCTCGRRVGDHTLDEWETCGAVPNQPYEPIPADAQKSFLASVGLSDYSLADNVVARASVLEVQATTDVAVAVALVLLDFSVGSPTAAPTTTAKVAFVAPASQMRDFGKLIRDTANGARDAAEQVSARLRREGRI